MLFAVCSIYGFINIAIFLKFSTKWYITDFSSSFLSSFAKIHGVVSSIYLFVLATKLHVSEIASLKCTVSNFSSIFDIVSSAKFSIVLSSSEIFSGYFSIFPSKYLFIIPIVLFSKFPKSLHKSELNLCTNSSGLNSPSCAYGIDFNKKYFVASSP